MKNKFSSYAFWIAVSGAVVIFLKNLCQALGMDFDSTAFESIVVSICGILVVLGVLKKDKTEETNSDIKPKNTEEIIELPEENAEEKEIKDNENNAKDK